MSDFLNWELTNRMHNLGYDGKTLMYIDDEEDIINDDSAELIGAKPAILTSASFRWLREKHELTWEHSFDDSQIQLYVGEIAYPDNCLDFFKSIDVKYDCYNKAFEEAELACLDKLIEIIESKLESNGN